jgi:2-octaprenylphenol hydroxylase
VVAALAARVRALGGVGLRNGVRLRDLQRTADGFRVHFDDDSSLDAALVVAADGALSPTRKLLGLRTREWDYGHRAIVTTVQFSDSHRCTAWQRFLPTGPLALLPLAGRTSASARSCGPLTRTGPTRSSSSTMTNSAGP